MNTVLENFIGICVILASTELVGRLCSKNAMVGFVRALVTLVLLVSVVAGLFSLDWDLSLEREAPSAAGEELSKYVEEQMEGAARAELADYLTGLLAAAGINAEKIQLSTDITEDGSIVLTEIKAVFAFESDAERARVLLRNVLGEEIRVEVRTDGR